MKYDLVEIDYAAEMFIHAITVFKMHYKKETIIEVLRDELASSASPQKMTNYNFSPEMKCLENDFKVLLKGKAEQRDIILKALIGAERLAYLIQMKKVPLHPLEQHDLNRTCYHAKYSIKLLERSHR
ncbi:MAG: hypothetical protein AAF228_08540 [Pseudomonadota bacterium]